MKLSQTRIAIVLAVLVVTSSGCGLINRIRAKNELNEAARTYRDGKPIIMVVSALANLLLNIDPSHATTP